jgi:cation transporter-like permease
MTGSGEAEKRMATRGLQAVVAVGSLVPIAAGAAGILFGSAPFGDPAGSSADFESHFRYLSGLLLGIGLAYLSAVPDIERRRNRFLLLGSLVVVGGLARLFSVLASGSASPAVLAALTMELLVTPALTFWQWRISARAIRAG